MKQTKKKVHCHRWENSYDSCNACGAFERICKNCSTVQLLNGKGKVIDESN